MLTLADQLIGILPEGKLDEWQKCGRKIAYAMLGDATAVALRRSKAGGMALYTYPCPFNQTHFHLSHMHPTPAQLEAMTAFSAKQQRRIELELRQLKRTVREAKGRVRATSLQFKFKLEASWSGTPFPSRIQAHYEALRQLLESVYQLRNQYLAAVYAHDAPLTVMESCKGFSVPGSAWRAVAEAKLTELAASLDALADRAAQMHEEELQELGKREAQDLAECREALNTRYGATG